MKNKGFTLVELIAVIVILGILSSLATVGVSRYRQEVKEKELVNLRSTIESSYDNYRSSIIMSGGSASKEIKFDDIDPGVFNKYFSDFSYSGNHLTKEDLNGSVFKLVVKGDLLNNDNYKENFDEDLLISNEVCLVESIVEYSESGESSIKTQCKRDEKGAIMPSKEEMLCIKLKVKGEVLIDDFKVVNDSDDAKNMRPLCRFWSSGETPDE